MIRNVARPLSSSATRRSIDANTTFAKQSLGVPPPLTVLSEEEQAFKETVQKLSKEKIEPLVKKMDENSHMDQSVIDALFQNGVNTCTCTCMRILNSIQ